MIEPGTKYDLMELARIGALYIAGDTLEEVMPRNGLNIRS